MNFSLLDLKAPPLPPAQLYKYVVADRLEDVLATSTVRFTQLMHTNDTFEVRRMFRTFAGPRLRSVLNQMIEERIEDSEINKMLVKKLQETGFAGVPMRRARKMLERQLGRPIKEYLRSELAEHVQLFTRGLNDPELIDNFLRDFGQSLFCFSLSETYQSAVMWAHYAGNGSGFAICFDTANRWFRARDGKEGTRLQKVEYLDGQMDEPLEDLQAAFISKGADWSYEREWRLYCGEQHIERTVGPETDPIHLVSFPRSAVHSIILGAKSTMATELRAREIIAARYPATRLFRASPQKFGQGFDLLEA